MGNTFLHLALLIIFHFSLPVSSMNLTTILTDQSALLALKDNVIHDPENVLTTNWSVSSPVCNWFGVSCGSKQRRVTAIDLGVVKKYSIQRDSQVLGETSFSQTFQSRLHVPSCKTKPRRNSKARIKLITAFNDPNPDPRNAWIYGTSTAGRKHVADNNCAVSVLQVALECSVEKPYKSPDMKEVVTKLAKIKVKLMKDMME
ncbi:hypothetical protein V6N11_038616 [Hibiscus sabdariffa]|uniref:Leucine-rich repeat-containing N-terminal plant-type domain-containing protein n=1 Tax=Hibiscus sabdariffa TaxID=183260 RepID=A0ABR2SLG1_9ROSI